eukprot:m.159431 g.159431  ORF g.159431 m.159431 type:complete len:510 (+) comp18006_c0_seq1:244-1773(+)
MDYHPVQVRRFPRLSERATAETRRWAKLKYPVIVKEFSAINAISFSPVRPYDFAAATSLKVQLYSSVDNKLKRSITRFKDVAYGCSFRNDGKLMVAGCETRNIQVFDMGSRAILRTFDGHTRAVRSTQFTSDGLNILSGSDDSTVRLWDLAASTEEIRTFEGHSDYVRACHACPSASHLFVSGSYDHTAKLWDARTGRAVVTVDHGAPIESVLMFPAGGSFITAGGNYIKIWDAIGRTRALHTFSNHQKTITCLTFDSTHDRLLSGSLDRQVKVYDVKDYGVIHSMKYSAPVLSMALSPTDSHLVVGMVNGMLSIRHRGSVTAKSASGFRSVDGTTRPGAKRPPRAGTYRFFVRGHDHKATAIDFKVEVQRKQRLKNYDKLLKKFKYHDALDAVLKNDDKPVIITSFLQELIYRSALKRALAGRDEQSLKPLLQFVTKHITNPRFSSLLIDVCAVILDLYGSIMGQSQEVDECFVKLQRKLQAELKFQQTLLELQGSMDLLLASRDGTA